MSNFRDLHNLKKIQKFNKIDQIHNKDNLKDIIIKSEKIEKPNLNIENLLKNRESTDKKELADCISKRTNVPYKGIIKNFDYSKKFVKSDDLIVHKVSIADKQNFEQDVVKFKNETEQQNKDIKKTYSNDKVNEHKKAFEYQHKYKYQSKLENNGDNDLRVDRIEFYKKEQEKMEDNKKKIDDILINLIDSGILSENLDTINYDKINVDDLEKTLIKEFGEEEYNKLLNELK